MKRLFLPTSSLVLAVGLATARVPDNLVTEGLPAIPLELRAGAGRYLEFRAAAFNGWHPRKREMLITTRFADSPQLHLVKMPGGARKQLAFLPEPVARGAFQPKRGECIVYTQDIGVAIARLQSDPKLEGERIAVMGGSYGGFMVLASMAAYSETLRGGGRGRHFEFPDFPQEHARLPSRPAPGGIWGRTGRENESVPGKGQNKKP